jgi:hypothetical protein
MRTYRIDELPSLDSVTGWPQTWWLTNQIRVDRDYAVFGELSFDPTPKWRRGSARGSFTAELFASNALDKRAETYRFSECTIVLAGTTVCGRPLASIVVPRTIGIRFSQSF